MFFKNWSIYNFKNGIHKQKKALNKSKMFIMNQKPLPLGRLKDSLKNTISMDQNTTST